MTNNFS